MVVLRFIDRVLNLDTRRQAAKTQARGSLSTKYCSTSNAGATTCALIKTQ
jgi:hypothetical protein